MICPQVGAGRLGAPKQRLNGLSQEYPVARVVVDVMLKPEILDPQGQAVANALPRLGVDGIASVRIGKRIEIEFSGDPDVDRAREIADRLLATRLGTACAGFINEGIFGVMIAARGDGVKVVPIEEVAGKLKTVALDHQWIEAARRVGTCLGD